MLSVQCGKLKLSVKYSLFQKYTSCGKQDNRVGIFDIVLAECLPGKFRKQEVSALNFFKVLKCNYTLIFHDIWNCLNW